MSLRETLRGTGVAIVTPFDHKGSVDFSSLGNLMDSLIRDGVDYLVVLGTTGETPTLSLTEKQDIIQLAYEKAADRVPVVVGIGGNDTAKLIREAGQLPLEKATAVLSASPYYSKPSQEGLFRHYQAFAEACPKPVLLYNVPGRTSRNINAATTLRLAREVPNIAGIKEASGDMAQCMQILKDRPEDFLVVSGDDGLTLPQIACGMEGVISVAANCFAIPFTAMVRHCLRGEFAEAKKINDQLLEGYELLFAENNPAGVKAVLAELGLIRNYLRLPLVPVSDEIHQKIRNYLKRLKASDLMAAVAQQ